jgi:hypothetical protein
VNGGIAILGIHIDAEVGIHRWSHTRATAAARGGLTSTTDIGCINKMTLIVVESAVFWAKLSITSDQRDN